MAENAGNETKLVENENLQEDLSRLNLEDEKNELNLNEKGGVLKENDEHLECSESFKKLAEKEEAYQTLKNSYNSLKQQHSNLLGKVSGIKSTLGERLKKDSQELAQNRKRIQELEKSLGDAEEALKLSNEETVTLTAQVESLTQDITDLRQQNASLVEENQLLSTQSKQWERRARDEHEMQESLAVRLADCEEQLARETERQEQYEVEIQRHLTNQHQLEIELESTKASHTENLGELTRNWQKAMDDVTEKFASKSKEYEDLQNELDATQKRLSRVSDLEHEVKEKTLLIGKLQHEAVVLNEHLTKALCMLKDGNNAEKIDKQLISNLFVSFLTLPRADTKRFEILQLISSVLDWNDTQREQTGLQRPGSSVNNWSIPHSASSNSLFSDHSFSKRRSFHDS